jgi:Fe-S-cluster-containing hydrogenase component 2
MGNTYAVRNIALCGKDCLCLYVCPTGASDTENSVIDAEKCIGCGACADACPSRAITMVPRVYPPQQPKDAAVAAALRALAAGKTEQELIAAALPGALAKALERSNRIMAEDLLREAGYMLPQSANARALLETMAAFAGEAGFPKEAVELLRTTLPCNEVSQR